MVEEPAADKQSTERINLLVEEGRSRLDAFLSKSLPELSRRAAGKLCEQGLVRVNHQRSGKGSMVSPGDKIEVNGHRGELTAKPERASGIDSLEVVFEDDALMVVEKPRAMHSVRLQHDDPPVLADLIAARSPGTVSVSGDPRESGLVQRLDYFTSGLVLVARTPEIWARLHRDLVSGSVRKEYLALVEGLLAEGSQDVREPLVVRKGAKKALTLSEAGEGAESDAHQVQTSVVSERRFTKSENAKVPLSLIRAISYHTVRHQIRAHLAHLGYPLLGDSLYGATRELEAASALEDFSSFGFDFKDQGFFLHASRIDFRHPLSDEQLSIRSSKLQL